MFLRTHLAFFARLTSTLTVCTAVLAGLLIASSPVLAAEPGNGLAEPVRALELQGFLAGQGDVHYLGLEPDPGVPSVMLTLVYRTADDALVRDGVNFTVLSADGMQDYLSGTPMKQAAVAAGRVLRADSDGTIVQESLQIDRPGNYTVIVKNTWYDPVRYMLSVHGGTLVDEGGQTLLRVPADPGADAMPEMDTPQSSYPHITSQPDQTIPVVARETVDATAEIHGSATHAGVASGMLNPQGDRLEFQLQPDPTGGEVTVHLNYRVDGGFVSTGVINFWVLTQEGMRHVEQGAFLAELNLATGKPEIAAPGQMATTVRLGATDTYALVVFNDSAVPAQFSLEVRGANLTPYADNGAVVEILTEGGEAPQSPAAMAVAHP